MAQLSQQGAARRPILTLTPRPKRKIEDPPDSLDQRKPTDIEDPEHPEDHPDSPPRDDGDTTEGESEQVTAQRDEARQELKDLEQNR